MPDEYKRAGAEPRAYKSLEQSLDGVIDALASAPPKASSRALLIEARRLRNIVVNWRSIPPAPHVHAEMIDRVHQLSATAGAAPARVEVFPEIETHEPSPAEAEDMRSAARQADEHGTYRWTEPPTARGRSAMIETPAVSQKPVVTHAGAARSPSAAPPPLVIEAEPVEPRGTERRVDATRSFHPPEGVKDAEIVADATDVPAGAEAKAERASPLPGTRSRVTQAPMPASPDGRLTLLVDPVSDRADAYRTLCRKLTTAGGSHVYAVTSANRGDGKTTCAANLALALREASRGRVLLVEANVQSPGLARIFGMTPSVCFHEQLEHHKDPSTPWEVVEPIEPLHVLAFDPKHDHGEMLDPVAFTRAMTSLKGAGYDVIVVDAPAVLGGGTVSAIADQVDGILLVAASRNTTRKALKRAHEQLAPAPVLGVILLE